MIATSHVIIGGTVGAIVAKTTENPALGSAAAFVAGIVSHFLCDLIPHLDHPPAPLDKDGDLIFTREVYIFAISDSLLAFFLTLFLWTQYFNFPHITGYPMGALGGYLPDLIDNVPLWRKQVRTQFLLKQFHNFHQAIHNVWKPRFPMPEHWFLGSSTQIVVVGFCIWLLS